MALVALLSRITEESSKEIDESVGAVQRTLESERGGEARPLGDRFTVPPRAHPSTGSQSGSATPGLTQADDNHNSAVGMPSLCLIASLTVHRVTRAVNGACRPMRSDSSAAPRRLPTTARRAALMICAARSPLMRQ